MRFLREQLVDCSAEETPYEEYQTQEPLRSEQSPEEPRIRQNAETSKSSNIIRCFLVFALIINKLTQFFCTTSHADKRINH